MMAVKRNVQSLLAAIAAFILLAALGGCSMANYKQLKSDPQVTQAFNAYQILPDENIIRDTRLQVSRAAVPVYKPSILKYL